MRIGGCLAASVALAVMALGGCAAEDGAAQKSKAETPETVAVPSGVPSGTVANTEAGLGRSAQVAPLLPDAEPGVQAEQAVSAKAGEPAWVMATPGMKPVRLFPGDGIEMDGRLRTAESLEPKGVALQFLVSAEDGTWSLVSATMLRAIPPGRPIEGRFARDFYRVVRRSGEVLYERPVVRGRDQAEWLDQAGTWHPMELRKRDQVVSIRLPLPTGEERLEVLHRQGTDTLAVPVFSAWVRSRP